MTQGLRNKDIAQEVGTTEQVVKNYLRKIYDKLGVSDRLELALYCMHHRLLENYSKPETTTIDGARAATGGSLPAAEPGRPRRQRSKSRLRREIHRMRGQYSAHETSLRTLQ